MTFTFEELEAGYTKLWAGMLVKANGAVIAQAVAHKLEKIKDYYQGTSVPWQFLAAIHHREADNNLKTQLLNGEHWDKKTTLVPKGLGPWSSFQEALKFAVTQDGLDQISEWSIERLLYQAEKWNGFGYRRRGINSPYVWSYTNQYHGGKYVADGKFDPAAWDQQIGVAALFKFLQDA